MTYFIPPKQREDHHLSVSEVQTSNMMPPMINTVNLEHLADCGQCYGELNDDAKERVQDFAKHRTKQVLTEVRGLMQQTTT